MPGMNGTRHSRSRALHAGAGLCRGRRPYAWPLWVRGLGLLSRTPGSLPEEEPNVGESANKAFGEHMGIENHFQNYAYA